MRTKEWKIKVAVLCLYMGIASTCPAKVIHVDADAAGANNGTSWANAYSNLQNALEDASGSGEIRVAQGIYKPGQSNRDETFNISGDLVIKGGYAGWGEPDPDARDVHKYPTVLSGDLAGNDVEVAAARDLLTEPSRIENSSRILVTDSYGEGGTPVLEGFTITGAKGDVSGGGLYINYGDAIVTDCIFVNNSAADHGGAMAFGNGRVIFTRCRFIRNAAQRSGGAVYLNGCGTCRSMYGAFTDCIFIDNYCSEYGGAIHNTSVSMATCINCLFVGNTAVLAGGALYDNGYDLGSYLVNCTLAGNNCTAVHIAEYGLATLSNCILWDNLCGTGTGRSAQILYQEGPWRTGYKPSVNYCCIQGWDGSFGGVGNFSANPLFVSPGSWDLDLNYTPGDYHLKPDSPCINAGDPSYVAEPTDVEIPPGYYWAQEVNPDDYVAKSSERDLDGGPRLLGGKVDMGTYEYYEYEPPALTAHWKLDESEGDTAKDSAGTNDGALHGGPQWQPYSGRLEGALRFDGENDYVNCGSDSAFDVTGQITVAAWANFNSVNMEWQTVIAKGDSAWRLSTASNYRRYHFAVTGGPPWNYINGDIEVAANEWHHVCGTYDGANLRLYIDGVEDPAGPVPELNGVTTDNYDVYIGENQERPGRYWDGLIDDVRIYNYALPASEVAQLATEAPIYVDDNAAGDPAPGDPSGSDPLEDGSRAHPFDSIQEAVDAADDGATIIVLDGAYTGTGNHDIDFLGKAITARSENGPEHCIIDCQGREYPMRRGFYFHGAENEGSVVDGFTIANGVHSTGAGILCANGASPTIRNNIIEGNRVPDDWDGGGGIACRHGASPLIIGNIIRDNHCEPGGGGGGIICYDAGSVTIRDNMISGNSASSGGAICIQSPGVVIENCTFTGNFAIVSMGGALLADSNTVVTNCMFSGNSADSGGAIYNYQCSPILTNCRFIANSAQYSGGAIFNTRGSSPTLRNCIFTGNTAGADGGAIYNHGYTGMNGPAIVNCTFADNSALHGNALACDSYLQDYPSDLQVANCILWDGGDEVSNKDGSTITITYSDVQNAWPGKGNIDADPLFANPASGDYHVKSQAGRWSATEGRWTIDGLTSPCIDAGDPLGPIGLEPFPNGGIVNMGAYGGTVEASKSYFGGPPCETIVAGDINGDCRVDFLDFRLMALHWLDDNNP